jgi:hypothetical protein
MSRRTRKRLGRTLTGLALLAAACACACIAVADPDDFSTSDRALGGVAVRGATRRSR